MQFVVILRILVSYVNICFGKAVSVHIRGCPHGLTDSMLDHRSVAPEFESHRGHIWRVFHLCHCFIIFGGHSAHLAYHVNKSSLKMSIIVRWYRGHTHFVCEVGFCAGSYPLDRMSLTWLAPSISNSNLLNSPNIFSL